MKFLKLFLAEWGEDEYFRFTFTPHIIHVAVGEVLNCLV